MILIQYQYMSNLVTPMLTSVENSPTVDFYPSSICFSNSPMSIIHKGSDQICLNDAADWNDLEHLVSRSPLFKSSTPNKLQNMTLNRRIFSNNCSVSHDSPQIQDFQYSVYNHVQANEQNIVPFHCSMEHSRVINNNWKASGSENNSCSKACVNINMGYNEGSSLESMVSNKKNKVTSDFTLSKHVPESGITNQPESTSSIITDNIANVIPLMITENNTVKTFKNGSKVGHSRQWGSCGNAVSLQLNFEDKIIKNKLSLDIKPLNVRSVSPDAIASPPTKTTEMRNKPFSQTNGLKRISQLSFEAEFDSEGRTHEQMTIDFRKFDPYIMSGQITLIELSYFKTIKPEEFLTFKWTGLSKHTHAPGIVASTRWFNQLNFWAQRIILECSELNRRSEMLIYLIRIIKKLVDCFNNLSSGMALMSALEVECIHRLKQTWNTLPNKDRATFRRLQELFSSANNYEKLREHINSLKLPCIPYLGLYLTDLTYINVAHSKLSEFESQTKTDQINNILRTVSEFQQSEYDVSQVALLYRYLESQRYIEELQKIIEENNYRSSMFLEPAIVEPSCQQARQQQDVPVFNSISPQKTPPSYACKHLTSVPTLQSPISPKLMTAIAHNESIKEIPETQTESQALFPADYPHTEHSANDNTVPTNLQSRSPSESDQSPAVLDDTKGLAYEESLMVSSRYSDADSVPTSLLCGAARKSHFRKRSTTKSIRFKRDSTTSSVVQHISKTATLSSSSPSALSDKECHGQHSKSLLDDSYLGETCSGVVAIDAAGQVIGLADTSMVSSNQNEALCSPPICRCLIKGESVDLKPKASTKRKTDFSNLVNIANAAGTAAQLNEKDKFYHPIDCGDSSAELSAEESPITEDKDAIKLVCQGVLSRKACLKNSRKSRFSVWSRYWVVLMMSENNAFLVLFESSHFHAQGRRDFKSKKCHVQDLKGVIVSRVPPSLDKNILEHPDDGEVTNRSRKFFLIDKEYGTVYKFREPSFKKSVLAADDEAASSSPNSTEMPSLALWYQCLRKCISRINRPSDDHKDLIVLGDS